MSTVPFPRRGQVFTLAQIALLPLRDSAHLMFYDDQGREQCIQNSHLTDTEHATLPGWDKTLWRFARETSEWIPLFHFQGDTAKELLPLLKTAVEYGCHTYSPAAKPREEICLCDMNLYPSYGPDHCPTHAYALGEGPHAGIR
jgi:hypothetical protein